MKNSEIARYWAARELTTIEAAPRPDAVLSIELTAPFACPAFTLEVEKRFEAPPRYRPPDRSIALREVPNERALASNTWLRSADESRLTICIDLVKGASRIDLAAV